MKQSFQIFLITIFLLMSVSCGTGVICGTVRTVSQLASLGISVVKMLNECTELSRNFTKKVQDVNHAMEQGMSTNRDIIELAEFWEKYWNEIHSDYDVLANKLNQTNQKCQEYFTELATNNSQMSNPHLKAEDQKKMQK